MKIWKRTVQIYTKFDPEDVDIEDLARDVMIGDGHLIYKDEELDDSLIYAEKELIESEFFHQCMEDQDTDEE